MSRWAVAVVIVLLAAVLFCVLLIRAFAHDAPSGHKYPEICCSPETDSQLCHPVDCEEVGEDAEGYQWRNLKFDKNRVFASFDDQCHVCNSTDNGNPAFGFCLLIRQTAWQQNLNRWARMYDHLERHP